MEVAALKKRLRDLHGFPVSMQQLPGLLLFVFFSLSGKRSLIIIRIRIGFWCIS